MTAGFSLFDEPDEEDNDVQPFMQKVRGASVVHLNFDAISGKKDKGILVSFYMMSSYAYYKLDKPFMSDSQYDELCRHILENLDDCREHPHFHLMDTSSLEAGTGFALVYPERVVKAYEMLAKEVLNIRY